VRSGPNSTVWDYFAKCSDLKIVHVDRQNLFERFLSRERGRLSGVFHAEGGGQKLGPIEIAADECTKFFEMQVGAQEVVQGLVQKHETLTIRYEEICSAFGDCVRRMLDFLGVQPPKELPAPKLMKLSDGTPRELVQNYDELRRHFQGSRYEQYFV